jgi:protein SCO1/2
MLWFRHAGLVALTILALASCSRESLVGTDLGGQQAPDFTLIDGSRGDRVTLSALRGRVVLITFLYTQCPDTCPLTAAKIHAARDVLGSRANDISFLAISVDPAHDTPNAIREFLDKHQLAGQLRYLIADGASLAAVWRNYSIDVRPGEAGVIHLDAIVLVDRLGRARILLESDVDPGVLAKDLQLLASE